MKIVKAAAFDGYNMSIAQLWGSGPMFTIRCGECKSVFKSRITMVNKPRVLCSLCGTINELDLVVN